MRGEACLSLINKNSVYYFINSLKAYKENYKNIGKYYSKECV